MPTPDATGFHTSQVQEMGKGSVCQAGGIGGIDVVLNALGESAKRAGKGWTARCPAHDDKKPSLSISEGADGKVLLKCHAGCTVEAITSALGLTMSDLFPSAARIDRCDSIPKSKVAAVYEYRDENNVLQYESVRYEPKAFKQRRPTADGKNKIWDLKGVRLIPYRLPELIAAVAAGQTIYIAEGEKDVETLREWGLAATCNPMGAGKWAKVAAVAAEVLRGAKVVVLQDDDEAGRNHAKEIIEGVVGIASELRLLPTLPGAKDVSGWKEHGGTREKLEAIVAATPEVGQLGQEYDLETITDDQLDQKEILSIRWPIPGFIPEGLSILVGNPKVGKSALVLGWAYALSQGFPIMGSISADKCEVLYLALEDNERRVQDRIRALRGGSPPAKGLHYITLDSKKPFRRLDDGGAEQIERYLDRHPNCRVVFIDTWAKVKPTKRGKNQQEYDVDSAAWSILHQIATKRRIAIVVLHHTRKPLKFEGDWILEISGTSGIPGTVDTILLFKRPRGETTATIMVAGRDLDEEKKYILKGDSATKRWTLSDECSEQLLPKGKEIEIFKVLQMQGALRPREIEKLCPGISGVRQYLQRMIERGFVIRGLDKKYSITTNYSSYGVTESYGVTAVTGAVVAASSPSPSSHRNSRNHEPMVEGEL